MDYKDVEGFEDSPRVNYNVDELEVNSLGMVFRKDFTL